MDGFDRTGKPGASATGVLSTSARCPRAVGCPAFFGGDIGAYVASTETPVGLGEPATTVVPPAIGNTIFAATGARVRHTPIRPQAVLQALAQRS